MSARCMASALNASVATSGHPERLKMWRNGMHVIFWLLFANHLQLTVTSNVQQLFSSIPMGYVGLKQDIDLSGKKCLFKLRNTHFLDRDKSFMFVRVTGTRSPWSLNYEQWCLISLVPKSMGLALCQPSGRLALWGSCYFVEKIWTTGLSSN